MLKIIYGFARRIQQEASEKYWFFESEPLLLKLASTGFTDTRPIRKYAVSPQVRGLDNPTKPFAEIG